MTENLLTSKPGRRESIPLSRLAGVEGCLRRSFLPTALLLMLATLYWLVDGPRQSAEVQLPALGSGACLVVWLALALAYSCLGVGRTEWEVRGGKLIRTEGVFRSRRDYLDLYRIQDAQVRWSFPGRLGNYGSVVVISTDKTDPVLVIGPVDDPGRLAEWLQQRAADWREKLRVTHEFT